MISLVAIPLSLVAALLVLYLRGATLNAMVLAGLVIALGVVIDDAIIDVERYRAASAPESTGGQSPVGPSAVILEASLEMRGAIFFATLIILLAVVPVFFLEGVSGALFQPLAVSYVLAVLASMLVALTVTPALSLILLSIAPLKGRESPLVPWLQRGYERVLARTAQRAVAGASRSSRSWWWPAWRAAIPQAGSTASFVPGAVPYGPTGGCAGHVPAGNAPIVTRASSELRAIPGVSNVAAHMGRAVFGDQVVGINSAELWVSIDPEADYDATVAAIQEVVDGYPGLDREVQTYSQQMLGQPQTEYQRALTVRVFGEDHDVLRDQAEKVQQALAGIDGVVDPQVVLPLEEPTLEIEVDLAAAQRYGVKPGDVRRSAATLLSGLQVGSLFEEQKVFDVVVWGVPEDTRQPDRRWRAADRHARRWSRAPEGGGRRARGLISDRHQA